jgi:hypothetical protein
MSISIARVGSPHVRHTKVSFHGFAGVKDSMFVYS